MLYSRFRVFGLFAALMVITPGTAKATEIDEHELADGRVTSWGTLLSIPWLQPDESEAPASNAQRAAQTPGSRTTQAGVPRQGARTDSEARVSEPGQRSLLRTTDVEVFSPTSIRPVADTPLPTREAWVPTSNAMVPGTQEPWLPRPREIELPPRLEVPNSVHPPKLPSPTWLPTHRSVTLPHASEIEFLPSPKELPIALPGSRRLRVVSERTAPTNASLLPITETRTLTTTRVPGTTSSVLPTRRSVSLPARDPRKPLAITVRSLSAPEPILPPHLSEFGSLLPRQPALYVPKAPTHLELLLPPKPSEPRLPPAHAIELP